MSAAIVEYIQPGFALELIEEPIAHEWIQWLWAGTFVAALALAAYCRHTGGWPSISANWWGFRIACYR